ncbi:MAG: GNAT family N-acetyltransferase, partial [Ktedonobacteraceae bacterium]
VGSFCYGINTKQEHRGKGYASEAILLVLRYYFQEMRYQKVTVRVYSFNEPSIKLHEKLSFQQEGRIRRTVFTKGHYYDELLYGMTAEEFAEKHSQFLPTVEP